VQRWHTKTPGNQEDVKKDERCDLGAAWVRNYGKCRGAGVKCQATK